MYDNRRIVVQTNPPYRTRLAVLLLVNCFLTTHMCFAGGENSNIETKKLVEAVNSGITHNYSQVEYLHADINMKVERRWVEKAEKIVNKLPDGSSEVIIKEPISTFHGYYTVSGMDYKTERIDDRSNQSEIVVCRHGEVMVFVPHTRTAWLRYQNQMPSGYWTDLKEINLLSSKHTVLEALRNLVPRKAEYVRYDNGKTMIRVNLSDQNQQLMILDFATDMNLLPIRCITVNSDRMISTETIISYEELMPGKCWFPATIISKATEKGILWKDLPISEKDWTEKSTINFKVKKINGTDNEPIEALSLPGGTALLDSISGRNFAIGEKRADSLYIYSRPIFLISLIPIVVIAVALGVKYLRSRFARAK